MDNHLSIKIRKFHYIYTSSATAGVSGSDLKAVYVQNGGKDTLYYTHTDYQGNLIKVTNEKGKVMEQYAYDPWGLRRNPTVWHEPDTRKSFLFDRGYTLHEHLDDFGLVNMNGRVYDPLLAQFLSPDPYIQALGNWLNYNRYAYGMNNPLMFSDPDGEFIWIIPNVGWSKSGGFNIGVSFVFGVPGVYSTQAGIGYNFETNDTYVYAGATVAMNTISISYSANGGASVGYSVGSTIFSGLPISTNFGTAGVNYNISHNIWSGNISAWQVDKSGWSFNPSASAMIYPEQTTNFIRKGKFINNDAMLKTFTDAGNYQGALDYFGFKGIYDPNNESFRGGGEPGVVDPITGNIFYNKNAFKNFDTLHFTADHEYWHHRRVVTKRFEKSNNTFAKEEYLNYTRNYRREGVYKNHKIEGLGARINSYGTDAGINPDVFIKYEYSYMPKWHSVYKVKRLW